jgi:hypothetical protein
MSVTDEGTVRQSNALLNAVPRCHFVSRLFVWWRHCFPLQYVEEPQHARYFACARWENGSVTRRITTWWCSKANSYKARHCDPQCAHVQNSVTTSNSCHSYIIVNYTVYMRTREQKRPIARSNSRRTDSTGLQWLLMVSSCDHGNESSGYIKWWECE